jgi:hypothetical protein
MQRDWFTLVVALLVLIAGTLFAHGDDLYLFLLGVAAADFAVLKFASMTRAPRPSRTHSGLLALAATAAFWFVLSQYFPAQAERTGLGYFMQGLIPSLALGGTLLWLYRNREPR